MQPPDGQPWSCEVVWTSSVAESGQMVAVDLASCGRYKYTGFGSDSMED